MKRLVGTLLMIVVVGVSSAGWAKDAGGHFGIGGKASLGSTLGGVAGVNGIYWLGRLGIDSIVDFGVSAPDVGDAIWNVRLGGGVVFNIVEAPQTNLGLGGRVLIGVGNEGITIAGVPVGGGTETGVTIDFEAPLRVEHFFTDHFAINAEVGLQFRVRTNEPGKGVAVGTETGLLGGAGFLFYI